MGEGDELSDAELLARVQSGGADGRRAFDVLVGRHQQWLVNLLYHLTGSQSDAEDVAQDAFVRAFTAIQECRRGDGFRPWLRVIARNLAFNLGRDRKTRQKYHERAGELGDVAAVPPGGEVDERQAINLALDNLSYAYREIIILRFVEELSVKEISKILDIGESATKMRLTRARSEFSQVFERS